MGSEVVAGCRRAGGMAALLLACAPLHAWPGDPSGPPTDCTPCALGVPSVSGFAGPALLVTDRGDSHESFVLHVFDVSAFAVTPPGLWWPPRFEHASWTREHLGSVFGVTSDAAGDVYLSHGSFMLGATVGSIGGGTGAIIRVASGTGTPSLLVSLPQSLPLSGPGLGTVSWSCAHDSLYASNFEDGRIYRIDPAQPPAARVQSAWDFATDSLTIGGAAEPGDAPGIAPLGERVWALIASDDRLYFSIWSRDGLTPDGAANTIWSVALDVHGDPVPGTTTLEITLDAPDDLTAPVASLAFDGACCLFAAQRPMNGFFTTAHDAELLRFCWSKGPDGGQWQRSGAYPIGEIDDSAAGGVAVDPAPNGFVWATGDFLLAVPPTYGVQGLPSAGGTLAEALMIDSDGDARSDTAGDKSAQGAVSFAVAGTPGCALEVDQIECLLGGDGLPTGAYSVTLLVANNTGQDATVLLVRTTGQVVPLDPPLQSGESTTLKLIIEGMEGDIVHVLVGLYAGGTPCCGAEVSFELPACRCALVRDVEVVCILDGDPNTHTYAVTFKVRNISLAPSFTASWLFLIPPQGAGYSFAPTVKNVFPLLPGAETTVATTLTFAAPPVPGPSGTWTLTVPASLHNANLAICCDFEIELEGPVECDSPCSPDLNGDGVVNGLDLAVLLGFWGPAGGGTCADLNGDGIVNGVDLAILLGAWS